MSSLIEQAAERLEQLRQAGIRVPEPIVKAPTRPEPLVSEARVTAQAARPLPPLSTGPHVELDLQSLAAANIGVPGAPRSQVGDQFRVIKRPLIANAMGKGATKPVHANLIMVTSALMGEGKSFTSVNLAMSIAAEFDNTVLLVDADVARPSLPRVLGLQDGPGLLDVLDGSSELSSVLLKTNVDKLSILRSGTPRDRSTEMLASAAMRQLLDDMSRRYPDRIIQAGANRVLLKPLDAAVLLAEAQRLLTEI